MELNNINQNATNTDVELLKRRQRRVAIAMKILTYTFLIVMALLILFPFYWMMSSSLKSYSEYHLVDEFAGRITPTFYPEGGLDFSNYYEALFGGKYSTAMEAMKNGGNASDYLLLLQSMMTTVIIGVVSTIASVIVTILAAFAFARLKFKGRELVFTILLMTMMVPGELFTITNYETVTNFNWTYAKLVQTQTFWPVYLSYVLPFLVSVFYIYLLRNNFKQIPDELYYAAKVDGTSDMKYLVRVMIPLALPSIISITILKMMGAWNSFIWPNLVGHPTDAKYMLISVILRKNYNATVEGQLADVPVRMAACAIVSLPLFIVFILFRKYIIRGVSKSGIKG